MDYDSSTGGPRREKKLHLGISIKNFWGTPLAVFDALDHEFDFDLDAAARAEDAKCAVWMGLDHPDPSMRDALTREGPWPGHRVFLNPPYSPDGGGIYRWVARSRLEVVRQGATVALVVLLLPGTMDTEWAEHLWEWADEIRFTPRIPFIDPMSHGRIAPMGGSMVAVLRRRRFFTKKPDVQVGFAPWKEK